MEKVLQRFIFLHWSFEILRFFSLPHRKLFQPLRILKHGVQNSNILLDVCKKTTKPREAAADSMDVSSLLSSTTHSDNAARRKDVVSNLLAEIRADCCWRFCECFWDIIESD